LFDAFFKPTCCLQTRFIFKHFDGLKNNLKFWMKDYRIVQLKLMLKSNKSSKGYNYTKFNNDKRVQRITDT